MTELIALWILLLVAVPAIATVLNLRGDGYGRRQPPRSHPRDTFSPGRFA